MEKEVLIHVRGLQMMDPQGEDEPIEIVVPGEYYYRNGSHYLKYEERMEDFREPTINYIKMSELSMEVQTISSVWSPHPNLSISLHKDDTICLSSEEWLINTFFVFRVI